MKPKIIEWFNKKKNLKASNIIENAISVALDNELDNALRTANLANDRIFLSAERE